jgi:hypothetical protein
MGDNRILIHSARRAPAPLACLCAAAMLLSVVPSQAQDAGQQAPPAQSEQRGFFDNVFHWFGEQAANFNSNLKNAGSQVQNFGREAGIAAKTTVDGAKGAADAVARIPQARVIAVHEKCAVAPNGAPDCVAVSMNACKAKGFESGKSVDMTTAEICPPKVMLSGRNSGAGCHDETFVSRVLCQ